MCWKFNKFSEILTKISPFMPAIWVNWSKFSKYRKSLGEIAENDWPNFSKFTANSRWFIKIWFDWLICKTFLIYQDSLEFPRDPPKTARNLRKKDAVNFHYRIFVYSVIQYNLLWFVLIWQQSPWFEIIPYDLV